MFGAINTLKEIASTKYVSDILSITDILEDDVTFVTKELTVGQVLSVTGVDYTGLQNDAKEEFARIRQTFFKNVPEGVKIAIHTQRRETSFSEPEFNMNSKYAEDLASERQHIFKKSFRTDIFMVVTYNEGALLSNTGIASDQYFKEQEKLNKYVGILSAAIDLIKNELESFKPRILKHRTNGSSELLSFWAYLLDGGKERGHVPTQTHNLCDILPTCGIEFNDAKSSGFNKELLNALKKSGLNKDQSADALKSVDSLIRSKVSKFSKPYVIFHDNQDNRYAAMLFMKYYPTESNYEILDSLLSVDHKFNVVQHIASLNKDAELADITMQRDRRANSMTFANQVYSELTEIAENLAAENFTLLKHSFSICVYGESPEEVEEGISKISSALVKKAISVVREQKLTEGAYWSSFPDYDIYLNPRQVKITSLAASDFSTFTTKQQGNMSCSFGDAPVCFFKTPDQQNYAFTFHPSPEPYTAGHTLIIGESSSGKSVLISWLMMNCLKYQATPQMDNLKMLVFDSLNGLRVPINAFEGEYLDFSKDNIPLNPLLMEDTLSNRRYLEGWLKMLASSDDGLDDEVIERIIDTNFSLPASNRSLFDLRNTIGVKGNVASHIGMKPNFASRISKWLPTGDLRHETDNTYGLTFNAEADALSFSKRIVGFDMTLVLKDQNLIAPITSYIFHAFQQFTSNTNSPSVIFMDEAIKFLNNDYFYPFIREALLEGRKKNNVFVGAIQDLRFLYDNQNGEEFLSSFQSYIIFPSSSATPQHYMGDDKYQGLGLTHDEYEWVKNTPKSKRQFMLKRKDGGSIILDANLSHLGGKLSLLRGDKDIQKTFDDILGNKKSTSDWQQTLINKFS